MRSVPSASAGSQLSVQLTVTLEVSHLRRQKSASPVGLLTATVPGSASAPVATVAQSAELSGSKVLVHLYVHSRAPSALVALPMQSSSRR